MRKLFLSFVAMCASAVAFAADGDRFQVGDIGYLVTSEAKKTVSVSSRLDVTSSGITKSYEGDVVIPETVTYGGVTYTVTGLGVSCAHFASKLTSLHIPKTVESYGRLALYGCGELTSITVDEQSEHFCVEDGVLYSKDKKILYYCIRGKEKLSIPEGVEEIFAYAFNDVSKTISEVKMPKSLRVIGQSAFSNCHKIRQFVLNEGLVKIDDDAFGCCQGFASIAFPASLTTIGCDAFQSSKVTSIHIPKTLTSIGKRAFCRMPNLESITVEEGHKFYYASDNVLYSLNVSTGKPSTLLACAGAHTGVVEVIDGVSSIADYSFYECDYVEKIVVPRSLSSIQHGCFCCMKMLTEIVVYAKDFHVYNSSDSWISEVPSLQAIRIPHGTTDFFVANWGENKYVEMAPEPLSAIGAVWTGKSDDGVARDLNGRVVGKGARGIVVRGGRLELRR